jgi:hypothetical protein
MSFDPLLATTTLTLALEKPARFSLSGRRGRRRALAPPSWQRR